MQDQSPIDPRINRYVFNACALFFTGAVGYSLLKQRWAAQSFLDIPFKALKKCESAAAKNECLKDVLRLVVEDARSKKGACKIAITRHIPTLISCIQRNPDGSISETAELALMLIQKAIAGDTNGCVNFNKAGGCRAVLSLLAQAHKDGHRAIMEDAAQTLKLLTNIDDMEVVLRSDVPAAAQPAYSLSQFPATIKMLRVLDPNAPIIFLYSITGVFCNIATLLEGARAINKGVEGHSGAWYFLRLLSHTNQGVVENSARTLSYIVRTGLAHEEISTRENLQLIAELVSLNMDPKTVNAALTIIVMMLDSPQSDTFFTNIIAHTSIVSSLISMFCHGSDRVVRSRAWTLAHLMQRQSQCTSAVTQALELNRQAIQMRMAQDEEQRRKEAQAHARQQEMFRQMMQQQMGGGGMPGMEDE